MYKLLLRITNTRLAVEGLLRFRCRGTSTQERRKLRPARKSQTGPTGQEASWLLIKLDSTRAWRLEKAPSKNIMIKTITPAPPNL
ncbi:hypothetical protein AHMF7605_06635 [Adhaeribacter arboris]|uniref:Uncharacterized protein n=1 Tax=Adhaeribacter arboris TaxID=2072846 RepID=A0A2T2YCI7_9BACT|nr:hypothetical protein AHMF7605_06635 [Adhaeribacter arboris]